MILDRNRPLTAGDVIEILVDGYPDLSVQRRIYRDGTFDYPTFTMPVTAAGRQIGEVASQIETQLKKELRRPIVTVSLIEIYEEPKPAVETPTITILGAVVNRGEKELPKPKFLRVLLAEVGQMDNADLSRVRVIRKDRSSYDVDYSKFMTTGIVRVGDNPNSQDILLTGGEEILVFSKPIVEPKPEEKPFKVGLSGAIATRGSISVDPGTSLAEALDQAGGPTPGADLTRVQIIGKAGETRINLLKPVSPELSGSRAMSPGERIVVPIVDKQVFFLGEVARSGGVTFRDGDTLLSAYLQVGKTAAGDDSKIEVIRGLRTALQRGIRDNESSAEQPASPVLPGTPPGAPVSGGPGSAIGDCLTSNGTGAGAQPAPQVQKPDPAKASPTNSGPKTAPSQSPTAVGVDIEAASRARQGTPAGSAPGAPSPTAPGAAPGGVQPAAPPQLAPIAPEKAPATGAAGVRDSAPQSGSKGTRSTRGQKPVAPKVPEPERHEFDIKKIMRGKAPDFPLQPGDVVYVPSRKTRRSFTDYMSTIGALATPLLLFKR